MRKNKQVIAMVAVKDLGKAAEFYEGALGFEKVAVEGRELITYRRCGCVFNIYQSDYAGAKKATALTWVVGDDLEAVVRKLKANGVAFEHYGIPGVTVADGIHLDGGRKVARLKDPDDNILAIVNR